MTFEAVPPALRKMAGSMHRSSLARRQRGFTYILMLFAVAAVSIGLAMATPIYSEQLRRQREAELVRIGALYVQAIESYYLASPGSVQSYPKRLEELLLDPRYVGTRRYMRKLYQDPVGRADWGLVAAPDGGVAGIYSRSEDRPLITRPIAIGSRSIGAASRYSDLKFVFAPDGGTK